jgi:hypothetical protein
MLIPFCHGSVFCSRLLASFISLQTDSFLVPVVIAMGTSGFGLEMGALKCRDGTVFFPSFAPL